MILLRRRALTGGDMPSPGRGQGQGRGRGPTPGGSAAGDLLVGQTVAIKESGTPIPYLVVHQGNPDAGLYDASCEGTWLLRNEIVTMKIYGSSRFYVDSGMPFYLNPDIAGTPLSGLDEKIKNAMKTVKIPYHASTGRIMSGGNGLTCKAFILSPREYGDSLSSMPSDGVPLAYFRAGGAANRIAYYNGEPKRHWTRSDNLNSSSVWVVLESGAISALNRTNEYGIRTAFILPYGYQFEESEVIA